HPAAGEPAANEPTDGKPAGKNGDSEPWSPAPPAGHLDWAKPGPGNAEADVDPAADWDRLAAGAQAAARVQAAGAQATKWRAQTDADVATEWPGPPLRTAMRNGLLASDAAPGPAAGQSVDDAQTDPGLPGPRPAGGLSARPPLRPGHRPGRASGRLRRPAGSAGRPPYHRGDPITGVTRWITG